MIQIERLHHDLEWAMNAMRTHRAVLILDLAGRIVALNQLCLSMCGYRRPELIGRPVTLLLDVSEHGPNRLRQILAAPDGREARICDLAQVSKTGRRFRVDARICPIRDDDGALCLNVVFLCEAADDDAPLHAIAPVLAGAAAGAMSLMWRDSGTGGHRGWPMMRPCVSATPWRDDP